MKRIYAKIYIDIRDIRYANYTIYIYMIYVPESAMAPYILRVRSIYI